MKKFLSILTLLCLAVTGAWADDYYTPTADEVIILNDVYSASATTAGYSSHSAVAWAGTTSSNSKKAGDPNNNGAATSGNVPCYSVKGNGGGKDITISITGVSKIIVYHESHSSRFVELRDGSKNGTLIGSGVVSTYYTEVDLDGTKSYSIFLHGADAAGKDQDINVYAVKLIKYVARTISTETFSGVKIGGTALTENAASAGYSVSGTTITLTDVAYVQPTNVTLTNHIVYTDETTEDKNVAVTFGETASEGFWIGTATIGTTTYTVKVPYEAQSVTAVTINGTAISADDLATLTSTKAVSIDGSSLNGIGTINVTLSGGTTTVSRANSGNDAVFTFTLNGTDNYTVTVTGVKKTYAAIGSIVYYQKGNTKAEGAGTKSLTANGINFSYPSKNFDYGTARVTIGSDEYQPIKLSTGEAVTVTFPAYKKATKVKVYGWSADGSNGRLSTFKESSSSEKDLSSTSNANIFYANNDAASIYPSVYEYELDNWESLYFQGSGAQPFIVMDFVLADSRNALESFAFSGGNTSVYTDALTTFAAPTLAATYGGSDVLADLTVTYASSNTAVATVDASTGVVTLTGTAGTAKITATFAGDATYQEASANYTITVAVNPVGEHTLTWTPNTNKSETSIGTASKNSTSSYVTVSNIGNAGSLTISGSAKADLTSKIAAPTAYDADKYMYVTFTVADNYIFTPSSISAKIQPVDATGDGKLVLTDGTNSIEKEQKSLTKGSINTVTGGNDENVSFTGTVTLKIYCYGASTGTYRLGSPITIEGEVTEVVPVTITAAEYATYCNAAKALDFSGTGITVFTATDNETSVKLNKITNGKVPANTPVVLYKEGADGTAISVPVIASADAIEGTNDLHVVSAGGLTGEDNIFVLAKNPTVGFYLWDKTKTLNEGKIYLQGKASYSSSRQFLGFEENTTGIGATLMNSERVNNGVYNLAGQRVAQPTKGLYIVNGKKVAIK